MQETLRSVFDNAYTIRGQMPLGVGDVSEPEPDVVVVRGHFREYRRHDGSAVLVVEVADSSLDFDRSRKAVRYASGESSEHRIVNPPTGAVVGQFEVQEVGKMRIGSIVIRCYEFGKMLAFWQEALHYLPRQPAKGGWVVLRDPEGRGPNVSLDQVPEKRSGKRSRLHLDLYTNNQEGEVERLIKIGATRYPWRYPPDADYIVLEDPDGNLFCVVQTT